MVRVERLGQVRLARAMHAPVDDELGLVLLTDLAVGELDDVAVRGQPAVVLDKRSRKVLGHLLHRVGLDVLGDFGEVAALPCRDTGSFSGSRTTGRRCAFLL